MALHTLFIANGKSFCANACVSSRLTKSANTGSWKLIREDVEISTIMVAQHKWPHMYLDAIIVEFCTQLRLRWHILVRLPRSTHSYSLDYGRGIFDIRQNDLTKERKWGKKKGTEEQTLGSLTSRVHTYNEIYHLFKEDHKKCPSINISRKQKSRNGISLGNYMSKSEQYRYGREIGFPRKLSSRRFSEISLSFLILFLSLS